MSGTPPALSHGARLVRPHARWRIGCARRHDRGVNRREAMKSFTRRQFLNAAGVGTAMLALQTGGLRRVFAADKIAPGERDVLLVIDVQNCFVPGGSLAVKGGHEIV